jgi:hypothetical protein
MQSIVNFFTGIADVLTVAFDWFIGFLKDLAYMVVMTGKVLASLPGYFSWLPEELVALIVTAFTFVVLYKILGREG